MKKILNKIVEIITYTEKAGVNLAFESYWNVVIFINIFNFAYILFKKKISIRNKWNNFLKNLDTSKKDKNLRRILLNQRIGVYPVNTLKRSEFIASIQTVQRTYNIKFDIKNKVYANIASRILSPIGLTMLVLKPILTLKTVIFILKNKYFVAMLLLIYLSQKTVSKQQV